MTTGQTQNLTLLVGEHFEEGCTPERLKGKQKLQVLKRLFFNFNFNLNRFGGEVKIKWIEKSAGWRGNFLYKFIYIGTKLIRIIYEIRFSGNTAPSSGAEFLNCLAIRLIMTNVATLN